MSDETPWTNGRPEGRPPEEGVRESGWSSPPPGGRMPLPPPPSEGMRPLSAGDVLDGMFRLLIRHWRTYLLAIAAVLVPVNVVTAVMQRGFVTDVGLLDVWQDPFQASVEVVPSPADIAAVVGLSGLIALLITPFVSGLACVIAAHAHQGGSPEPKAALGSALRRYPAFVGASLLTYLAVLAVYMPAVGLIIAGGVSGSLALVSVGAILAVLLIAAVVAVFVLLWFALPVIAVEGVGPLRALRRSASLVRGSFWRVLGIGLLVLLISTIITSVAAIPLSLPGNTIGGTTGYVLASAGTLIASILAAPLIPNAQTLLYFDARVRKEGLDLEMMTRALEHGDGPAGGRAG